jgi:sortase A
MAANVDRVLDWLQRALLAIGVASFAWCGGVWLQATIYQHGKRAALDRRGSDVERSLPRPPAPVAVGDAIGTVDIPRLRLSAVVIEGDDDSALKVAVGHLPDTPLPWEGGNSALAAHRDTFFRPLKDLVVGDLIRVVTPRGELDYHVRETLVVNPDDVWVLNPTAQPSLTLITCYPFSFVGHAPRRFVVRAEQVRPAQTAVRTIARRDSALLPRDGEHAAPRPLDVGAAAMRAGRRARFGDGS